MKRTAFARKPPPPSLARVKEYADFAPRPRSPSRAVLALVRMGEPVLKECPIQHEGYMAIVRTLACARCTTVSLPRQFCHRDEGKGLAIKTDCREGWPGCAVCHYFVGSSGKLGKEGRRAFELKAGADARAAVLAAGLWPARLPRWPT